MSSKHSRLIIPKATTQNHQTSLEEILRQTGLPPSSSLLEILDHCYAKYLRLLREHQILSDQHWLISKEKEQLGQKCANLDRQLVGSNQQHKSRFRRTAGEIARNFICPVPECTRCYGTEGSLAQHIKLKHPEYHFRGKSDIPLRETGASGSRHEESHEKEEQRQEQRYEQRYEQHSAQSE